jgi:type IV pilus assembly protein PilM
MNIGKSVQNFFSDLTRFFTYREMLGVDIGTVAVKLVELRRTGNRVTLGNYGLLETRGYLERGNAAIQTSSLKLVESDVASYLATLIREVHPTAKNVVASIPSFGTFVAPVEVPLLSAEETEKLLTLQARQYIPLPLESVNLEWVKVEEFDNQRGVRFQRLLLTAIPRVIIRSYQAIFRNAGLKLVGLETESQALIRSLFTYGDPTTFFLDIGAESTSLAVVENGIVRQAGQVDYGGATLTNAVARTLGISLWRAEELKRRRGLSSNPGEYDLSTALTPFLDVIVRECDRIRRVHDDVSRNHVERLVVVGGGANLPGITDYLAAQLGLSARSPFPFAQVAYPPELEPAMKQLSNEFSLSIGLAWKYFIPEE